MSRQIRNRAQAKVATVDAAASRRRVLIWGAAAAAGAAGAALLGRPAAAFSLQDADAKTLELYHSACGPNAYHAKLVEEARALLEGGEGKPAEGTQAGAADPAAGQTAAGAATADSTAAGQTVACPVCGCRLALYPAATPVHG